MAAWRLHPFPVPFLAKARIRSMIVSARPSPSRFHSTELLAPPLTGGARVDVCIVGAGLAGMIAAYLLARERRSVLVIDEGPIGGVQGGFEAAHLATVIEKPYAAIEAPRGAELCRRDRRARGDRASRAHRVRVRAPRRLSCRRSAGRARRDRARARGRAPRGRRGGAPRCRTDRRRPLGTVRALSGPGALPSDALPRRARARDRAGRRAHPLR